MLSSLLPDMEDSWEYLLSHLGMNDDSACTNAAMSSVSIEDMVRFSNGQCYDSSHNAVEAASDAKQEYSNNSNLKSREEELLGSCYALKKDVENKHELENTSSRGTKRARTSLETQDHIISERKRRRDIAEKFIAHSATIPGLKVCLVTIFFVFYRGVSTVLSEIYMF